MKKSKYEKRIEDMLDKGLESSFKEAELAEFHNFKLFALAEKIKSQTSYRPKPKMLYY